MSCDVAIRILDLKYGESVSENCQPSSFWEPLYPQFRDFWIFCCTSMVVWYTSCIVMTRNINGSFEGNEE